MAWAFAGRPRQSSGRSAIPAGDRTTGGGEQARRPVLPRVTPPRTCTRSSGVIGRCRCAGRGYGWPAQRPGCGWSGAVLPALGHMVFHRLLGHRYPRGDLPVGQALTDQLHGGPFTAGQRGQRAGRRRRGAYPVEQDGRGLRVQQRPAGTDRTDRVDQIQPCVMSLVTNPAAPAMTASSITCSSGGGEHQTLQVRQPGPQLAAQLHAVAVRQPTHPAPSHPAGPRPRPRQRLGHRGRLTRRWWLRVSPTTRRMPRASRSVGSRQPSFRDAGSGAGVGRR